MFIDFEGIDGSGKTTLSNRLASRLKELGHRVCHARAGGKLQAPTAQRIREITRDAHLLELGARAELFLNLARESQQLDEVVRPALARGEVCIADRYVYSQIALAEARGLPREEAEAGARIAAEGTWPDLVVLVDVAPDLARLRKRLGKIRDRREREADSRKGLAGAGLAERAREAFLRMAREDPARWLVVPNEDQPLCALEEQIAACAIARLEGRPAPQPPARTASVAHVQCERVERSFLELLEALERREPDLCAYSLSGLSGAAVHRWRVALAGRFPEIVARGLGGLDDDGAWELRGALAPSMPEAVARSLAKLAGPRAAAMREALFGRAAEEVVAGLRRLETEDAWRLRERAFLRGHVESVLAGLAGVEGPRAWTMRERCAAAGARPEWMARSLTGLCGARADDARKALLDADRLAVLRSTAGVDTPFARLLRESLFDRGTKVVLRSLSGLDVPYAWELRERAAPLTKESLDSIDGMACERAWSLRERFVDLWPATVISSLWSLPIDARARALIDRGLERGGARLPALRNAYAVLSGPTARTHPGERTAA